MRLFSVSIVGRSVNNQRVLTTNLLEKVVQGHSNQVKDLIKTQKGYNSIHKPKRRIYKSRQSGIPMYIIISVRLWNFKNGGS